MEHVAPDDHLGSVFCLLSPNPRLKPTMLDSTVGTWKGGEGTLLPDSKVLLLPSPSSSPLPLILPFFFFYAEPGSLLAEDDLELLGSFWGGGERS